MRSSCVGSPLQALYTVFVNPSLRRVPVQNQVLIRHLVTGTHIRHAARTGPTIATSPRPILKSPHRSFHSSTVSRAKTRPPETRSQLWNEEIPARFVTVVDPATNTLSPPQRRADVLRSFDQKTHRLVCLTHPPKERGLEEWIPLCKILSKSDQYKAEKAKKEQRKDSRAKVADSAKTLELNWAIDGNDLGHRLKRMQEFLGEGRKVEIVLAKKKHGRVASLDECEEVLGRIKEAVGEVKGAKEVKPMDGKIGGVVTLSFEGQKP